MADGENLLIFSKAYFYNYFLMPIQFIFLLVICSQILRKAKAFYGLSILYLLSFIPNELYFSGNKIVFAFNYTFGCLILMLLVVMEYYKQINSQDILHFNKNRMFYINLGITLSLYRNATFYGILFNSVELYGNLGYLF